MKVHEFTGMLEKGRFLIPSFQREFVWDQGGIIKLWESLYRFYPIGSILCWETDIRLNIHRKVGGVIFKDLPNDVRERVYILDGQQRATALLLPLVGREWKTTGEKAFDYTLYFDATDESFFFAHELNRRKRNVPQGFLICLGGMVRDDRSMMNAASREPGFGQAISKSIAQLARIFSDYNLSLIRIKGYDIPAVREIFERINQEGKALTSMDIMIARTFRDYEYPVEEDLFK
ncbi:conserved hypothetical protein [delta proteobacterium NaphS2]|nr:conserved hypothetical protein [delta proteobacterium NaphS2]